MKYTLKPNLIKTFDKVKAGEVFQFAGGLYLKTNEIAGKNCINYNAVQLSNGGQQAFSSYHEVSGIGEYEIIPLKETSARKSKKAF